MYRTATRPIAAPRPLAHSTKDLLYWLALLLALSMPFEVVRPLLSSGPILWTNLELLVAGTALVLGIHLLQAVADGRGIRASLRHLPWRLAAPALLFLGLATLSAILAPTNVLGALKVVTRFAMGLYAFALVIFVADRAERVEGLLWAIAAGAGLSALLGWFEALGWAASTPLLALFKEAPSRVGGELRVSGSFQYATVASMFFEATTPLALVLAVTARARAARWLALLVALLGSTLVVETLTRSGMVTLALVLVGMLLIGLFSGRGSAMRGLVRPVVTTLLALVLVVALLVTRSATFRTRLTTENDLNWYGATYTVPTSLELESGAAETITVTAHNTGQATWQAEGENPFALGYQWLTEDGQLAGAKDHYEVALPRNVAPGTSIELTVPLDPALPPGNYRLEWSMLQQNILWFSDREVPAAETAVSVERATAPTTPPPPLAVRPRTEAESLQPTFPPTVGRRDLWRAGWLMWRERPLLGVGPGNFRHLYGQYLGMADWDDRIYANNLYVEFAATLGILGAAAFGWLVLNVLARALRAFLRPPGAVARVWLVGLAAGAGAFLLHGLLDYFLEVVSLYLLFWITLGLIVALSRLASVEEGAI
ncbi:MAG TPA: O-antigen ligase family protein [Ardenticatenaceae bacterium]|jgi:hypothetical protein